MDGKGNKQKLSPKQATPLQTIELESRISAWRRNGLTLGSAESAPFFSLEFRTLK
jgi:hypothetical protein